MSGTGAPGQPLMRTPGIVYSALVFALLGFACAVPAIVGLVLGLMALPRARAAGAGAGLAIAAIAVSAAWLLFFGILVVIAQTGS